MSFTLIINYMYKRKIERQVGYDKLEKNRK